MSRHYLTRAFSHDRKKTCVDCGKPADRLLDYDAYDVGDLVCVNHVTWRKAALGRTVAVVPIPRNVKPVPVG